MFIQNKYYNWYINITKSGKQFKFDGSEKHHIIPKSLGGSDNTDNCVYLSYKQHFVCHLLLTKCCLSDKMIIAFHRMCNSHKSKVTSRIYSYSKRLFVESISGENHWAKTDSFKKQVSSDWTEDRKIGFSKKVSGENHWTKRHNKQDINDSINYARSFIDPLKEKERKRKQLTENNPMKNPEISKKFKHPKPKVICPYCGKQGGLPVMKRYHFEKCKKNDS